MVGFLRHGGFKPGLGSHDTKQWGFTAINYSTSNIKGSIILIKGHIFDCPHTMNAQKLK